MSAVSGESPGVVAYRLTRVENDAADLKRDKAEKSAVDEIKEEIKSLRRTLITFLVGVSTASIGVIYAVLQARGKA